MVDDIVKRREEERVDIEDTEGGFGEKKQWVVVVQVSYACCCR